MHPYIVHAVIGFALVGIMFRLLSVTPWFRWSGHAAAITLIIAALVSIAAVKSGTQAHGPVEQIPGVRSAVQAHEEWGENLRDLLLVIGAVEAIWLLFASRRSIIRIVSALLCVGAIYAVYETGKAGGELVYDYAGGPGLRSGDPAAVGRLLVAGLYEQAMQDRREGKSAEAASLLEELARRRPDDPDIRMIAIESMLRDRHDPAAALAALDAMPAASNPRTQRTMLLTRVNALIALGMRDSARVIVEELVREAPQSARYKALLDSLR
jgi:uncharacterized membrane protein